MKIIKTSIVILSCQMLAGCSWLYGEDGLVKDSSYEYVNARQTKDIQIPGELTQKRKVNFTPVPAIGEKAKQAPYGKEVKVSAPIQILAVLDNIRIDKKADNPAVFILDDSDFLWRSIIEIFEENEAKIEKANKQELVIETDWLAVDERGVWLGVAGEDDIDEFRAKYRVKFTDGVLKDEKRMEVSRIAAEKLDDETEQWQPVPSFWQDSADMLNLLISSYDKKAATRDQARKAAMVAGFKVQMAKDEEDAAALVTEASMEHVWEKLPKVLEALEFDVNDRDRRLMTYFVNYQKEEAGFFASLFSEEKELLPIDAGDYQVTLRQLGERTAIVFRDGQGEPLNSQVLTKLYPTLSQLFGDNR
ncbi:outer membrane protein assembly factor BamC [Aliikangiella marina]|uniref:Outer membrane protein assembly factor BamC n=1 Tax=Aliikangiella marina TaxID=1712262 RepID=A0A545TID0_9GAMM|nr:outer membrane protein assembly factor BamC [Aliikangiella marina]TQV76977.1 outer membrane protein assembly factor BamC [Aliikangiella marina]